MNCPSLSLVSLMKRRTTMIFLKEIVIATMFIKGVNFVFTSVTKTVLFFFLIEGCFRRNVAWHNFSIIEIALPSIENLIRNWVGIVNDNLKASRDFCKKLFKKKNYTAKIVKINYHYSRNEPKAFNNLWSPHSRKKIG